MPPSDVSQFGSTASAANTMPHLATAPDESAFPALPSSNTGTNAGTASQTFIRHATDHARDRPRIAYGNVSAR